MRIFLMGEYYPPLRKWYEHGGPPEGVPAILALYQFLGSSNHHLLDAIIFTPDIDRVIPFSNGSTIRLISLKGTPYRWWKLKVLWHWLRHAGRYIENESYDIIYAQGTWTSIASYWGRRLGIPSVGRIYGTILTADWYAGKWYRLYTRHLPEIIGLHRPCDLTVITKDGTDYDKILSHYSPKAQQLCLYNGMDKQFRSRLLSYALPTIEAEKVIELAYIGRLYPYKQQQLALEMCQHLKSMGRAFRLHIIGTGPDLEALQAYSTDLGINEAVVWVGSLVQENLMDYIASVDVCLFYYEGGSLGNTLWECGMAGRIISAIDTGTTANVIIDQDTGLISKPGDAFPMVMAQKIAHLDSNTARKLGQNIRQWVCQHIGDWEERFEREFEVIENSL